MNKRLVLISGETTTGKSACLRNIKNPSKSLYLNSESGKDLPFASKFKEFIVTDPLQVPGLFDKAEKQGDKCDTIIVDSVTYLLDMFETLHVIPHTGTKKGMTAWGDFAQYFKSLMQNTVANSTKNVIMTAHTLTTLNEDLGFMQTVVPVKGSLKNNGIESYFSCVVSTKKVAVKDLEKYDPSPLLNITAQERALGYKYVFQTQITKETVHDRIRSPMGMWAENETFIDNDVQLILDRLDEYYA